MAKAKIHDSPAFMDRFLMEWCKYWVLYDDKYRDELNSNTSPKKAGELVQKAKEKLAAMLRLTVTSVKCRIEKFQATVNRPLPALEADLLNDTCALPVKTIWTLQAFNWLIPYCSNYNLKTMLGSFDTDGIFKKQGGGSSAEAEWAKGRNHPEVVAIRQERDRVAANVSKGGVLRQVHRKEQRSMTAMIQVRVMIL